MVRKRRLKRPILARLFLPSVKSLRRGYLLAGVGLTALFVSGCATVGDVTRRDADLERRMERTLDDRVSAARAEDQKRIEELEANLATHSAEYSSLAERLSQSESRLAELAEILSRRLEGLAKDFVEMRRIAGRLDSEMDRLPLETLRQLKAAIDTHLANQPRAPVGAAPDEIANSREPAGLPQGVVETEWIDGSPADENSPR